MARRLALFDPARRLTGELAQSAASAGLELVEVTRADDPVLAEASAILVVPAVAGELGPAPQGGPPRWIVGDASNAARLAGAAAQAGAAGALLLPVSPDALAAAAAADSSSREADIARARSLIAVSVLDTNQTTLQSLAEAFTAHDCVVWWKDGESMTPESARGLPDGYRQAVAAGARIAAASGGSVVFGAGGDGRGVIAEALRTGPTEVAGLIAIVADKPRRFSLAERTDLRAVAARLVRELQWMTGHRRLVAEGERLLAGSLLDPLTSALTRGAFEQAVTGEVAAAGRRGDSLTVAFLDIVGLRKINHAHGHAIGDEVLVQVAATLRATIRGSDRLARYGGDEMAVLLVGATAEQSVGVVQKLIDKVAETPVVVDALTVPVQLRAALSQIGANERSGEAAFARALSGLRRSAPDKIANVAPSEPHASDGRGSEIAPTEVSGLTAGTIVGGAYRVLHELSRGAMGVVYRGEDLGLSRPVAIKVLRSDLASDRELVTQFRAEAALLASLHHENLVQVYSLGEHAGDVYFVMELVEGQPVSDVLRVHTARGDLFPLPAVAQIALEIGDALDAMHAIGVVHRDVKPANILLDRERDRAVLVDVGVAARAGQQHDAAGTPGFAAPESFLAASDAKEVDVYGLAATVYCMLTGVPPFGAGNLTQVVARQLNEKLAPVSEKRPMSNAVDAVLAKALEPNPKKRWATAATFAIALARALERKGDTYPPATRSVDADAHSAQTRQVKGTPDAVRAAEAVLGPTVGITDQMRARRPLAGKVRAAHFRVGAKVVAHKLGDATVRAIVGKHPPLAGALAPTISPLDWLELEHLASFLVLTDARSPESGLPRLIGRGTVTATFTRLFGANPSSLPVATVLRAAPAFWKRYHDWCQLGSVVHDHAAEITIDGDPGSPLICDMIAGELGRIAELAGGKDVAADHPQCRCKGAAVCQYLIKWS